MLVTETKELKRAVAQELEQSDPILEKALALLEEENDAGANSDSRKNSEPDSL